MNVTKENGTERQPDIAFVGHQISDILEYPHAKFPIIISNITKVHCNSEPLRVIISVLSIYGPFCLTCLCLSHSSLCAPVLNKDFPKNCADESVFKREKFYVVSRNT
jgi:hypothetical protein